MSDNPAAALSGLLDAVRSVWEWCAAHPVHLLALAALVLVALSAGRP